MGKITTLIWMLGWPLMGNHIGWIAAESPMQGVFLTVWPVIAIGLFFGND